LATRDHQFDAAAVDLVVFDLSDDVMQEKWGEQQISDFVFRNALTVLLAFIFQGDYECALGDDKRCDDLEGCPYLGDGGLQNAHSLLVVHQRDFNQIFEHVSVLTVGKVCEQKALRGAGRA